MDLIQFYSEKIANFETERKIFTNYVNRVVPNNAEFHMLEWETKQQEDMKSTTHKEMNELDIQLKRVKSELEDAQMELLQVRDDSSVRKTQIQRLSELSLPVETDTTYVVKDLHSKSKLILYK